jgi:hypothetical protein
MAEAVRFNRVISQDFSLQLVFSLKILKGKISAMMLWFASSMMI